MQPTPPDFGDPFRVLFDAHPLPLWVFDEVTLRFLDVNQACVYKYGYSRDEFLELHLRDVIASGDIDRLLVAESLESGHLPWRHRTKAGAVPETEVAAVTTMFQGRPARLVVASDVTEYRMALKTLRERESLLQGIIANIPVGVFWKDRASIYVGCNDRVVQDFGLSSTGEVIGQTDYELAKVPEDASRSRASDRRVFETGERLLNVEEIRTLPNGTAAVFLTSRAPMRNPEGEVIGVLGVYQEITERKRLEEELRQAQKMEALGRLAGGVAHDFNNLMTVILGAAQLLGTLPTGSPDGPPLVHDITDAAERATDMTRELLTFSRQQPVRAEVVDLNAIVSGSAPLLRRLGERVVVCLQQSPTAVMVQADRGQLEQVVMSLAVNARDAMPSGGTLVVGTRAAAPWAELTITDTGVGMPPEVKEHIFEPFFTTKNCSQGTGLGLATVHAIVEQAGGMIEVESAPGAGTTFHIRLPLCEAAQPAAAEPTAAGQGRTVLLVESEDRIRKLGQFVLESQKYRVVAVASAEAALPVLGTTTQIDAVVAALTLPGMDGRKLATLVRQAFPAVGVVLMIGQLTEKARAEGLERAVVLPKPFVPKDMAEAAARAIAGARGPTS